MYKNEVSEAIPEQTIIRRYPQRNRKKPTHLQDFETEETEDKLQMSVDRCYKVVCDVPQTYKEAITSLNSKQWKEAMREEMQSLKESETFVLTQLPQNKKTRGKWVFKLKNEIYGSEKYKARYVAKCYSQKQGIDYEETFSPTADMTSVRVVMQKAASTRKLNPT